MENMRMDIVKLKLEMAQAQKDIDKALTALNYVQKLPTRMELWTAVISIVVPVIILIISR